MCSISAIQRCCLYLRLLSKLYPLWSTKLTLSATLLFSLQTFKRLVSYWAGNQAEAAQDAVRFRDDESKGGGCVRLKRLAPPQGCRCWTQQDDLKQRRHVVEGLLFGGRGGAIWSGELKAWLTLISEKSPGNEAIMWPAICHYRCWYYVTD